MQIIADFLDRALQVIAQGRCPLLREGGIDKGGNVKRKKPGSHQGSKPQASRAAAAFGLISIAINSFAARGCFDPVHSAAV